MYACVCNAVTDRRIAAAVANGARSIGDLMVQCDAGTCCGACHDELERLLTIAAPARRPTGTARPLQRS